MSQHEKQTELNRLLQELQDNLNAIIAREKRYFRRLKLHHKIIFAFLVFFGINLLWYGMWEIVSDIPFLNNPFVALCLGSIILIATGYLHETLISSDYKNQEKKTKARKRKFRKY